MTFCEIKHKRARDLTDRDVIVRGSKWREVLGVYQSIEDVEAEFGPLNAEGSLEQRERSMITEAFDRIMDAYVLVRVWLPEASPHEVVDEWLRFDRYELVQVQSLPAWDNPMDATQPPLTGDRSELSRLLAACDDDNDHDVVVQAARRAGLLWQCECSWDNREDEPNCGGCGKPRIKASN